MVTRDETASKDDTDIEPYCIKLFEHHWYGVGHLRQKDFSSESFAVFDFDCIEALQMPARTVSPRKALETTALSRASLPLCVKRWVCMPSAEVRWPRSRSLLSK